MPGETDQAVGFMLEFRNEASADLQQAVSDFDEATAALERAVDAAQAAFVFLEEGSRSMATDLGKSVDSAVKKTDELKGAMKGMADVEVEAPNIDPVTQAIERFGEEIEAPIDPGFEEVEEDLNELELKAPSMTEFIAWQTMMGTPTEVAPVEDENYRNSLEEIKDTLHEMSMVSLPVLDEMEVAMDRTAMRIHDDIVPDMEEFGEAGRVAAHVIAHDAANAYQRLQDSAARFLAENRDAMTEANDVAEVWDGFLKTESADLEKVQDLLRMADKADLGPLVENLVDQFGDAALSEAFWGPIAANENVDKEFFRELRDQFKREDSTYETWWDRMGETAQDLFWPIFEKQGEEAAEGIASSLGSKLKSVFQSPIGQFTAALTLANILTRIFGPVIEELTRIIGQFLLPFMRMLISIMDALRPPILALSKAMEPLLRSFGEIFRELAEALTPMLMIVGDLFEALTPLLVVVARLLAGAVAFGVMFLNRALSFLIGLLDIVLSVGGELLGLVAMIIRPLVNLVVWLGEVTGITKILGFVISAVLVPAIIGWAASAIPAAITAISTKIGVMGLWLSTMWSAVAANAAYGASLLATFLPAVWGAVTATWAFTVALLANPITWIVLAVVAAVGLLAGAIWLLWEPIKAVFSFFGELFDPILNGLTAMIDLLGWLFGFTGMLSSVFSFDFIMNAVNSLTDFLFGWFNFIPGWVKWLLGIDDEETVESAPVDTTAAEESVTAFQEDTQKQVESSDEWFRSMLGDEEATDELAVAAAETYTTAGETAGDALEETVATAADDAERAAGGTEQDAMGRLTGAGDLDLMGSIFDVGMLAGSFMLQGMTSGLMMIAQSFPLDRVFGMMFGPFANVLAQPATTTAQPPAMAGVSVGGVQYEVDATLPGSDISAPIVAAINQSTGRIVGAIEANSGNDLNLDLTDMKDVAGF